MALYRVPGHYNSVVRVGPVSRPVGPTAAPPLEPIIQAVDPAVVTLSGETPAVVHPITTVVDPAVLTLTGETPAVVHPIGVIVDPATLTLAGQTPTVIHPVITTVDIAVLTLSGQTPGAAGTGSSTNTVDPAVLTLTGQTPGAGGTGTSTQAVDSAVITLSGQTPLVLFPVGIAGTTSIGGNSAETSALWHNNCFVHDLYTHVASIEEKITDIFVYGDGTGSSEVAIYEISGGVPIDRAGNVYTINVGASAGWYSVNVDVPLEEGVRYGMAIRYATGFGSDFYNVRYDSEPAAGRVSSQGGLGNDTPLPTTWNDAGNDDNYVSMYAVVKTSAPPITVSVDPAVLTLAGQTPDIIHGGWQGAITLRDSQSNTDAQTVTSASFTPAANSLLFVQHSHSANGHSTAPDVQISNTGGLTFTRYVTDVVDFAGPNDIQGALFVASVGETPPEDMTVTVDPFTTTDTAYQSMIVYDVTEAAILQAPEGKIVVSGDTTHTTETLSTTTDGNLVIVGFSTHTTGSTAVTEPSGFTTLEAQNANYQMQSVFYATDFVGTDVTSPDLGESLFVTASWIMEIADTAAGPIIQEVDPAVLTLTGETPALPRKVIVDPAVLTLTGETPSALIATTTQHSFRWRNDDGDEDSATWAAAENTDISSATEENRRLRFVLDTTNDVASTNYKLHYKESAGATWGPVPVGDSGGGAAEEIVPIGSANEWETDLGAYSSAVQLDSTHWLVTYMGGLNDGFAVVQEIDSAGAMTIIGTPFEFDTVGASGAETHPVAALTDTPGFAVVAFRSDLNSIKAVGLTINTSTWAVGAAGSILDLDTSGLTQAISHVSGDDFLVVYRGPDNDGWAATLSLDTGTGVLTNPAKLEFDIANCIMPALSKIDDEHYLVTYMGTSNDGFATVLEVNTSTLAITEVGAGIEFDTNDNAHNALVKLDATHYLEVWSDLVDAQGHAQVLTVNASTWNITAEGTPTTVNRSAHSATGERPQTATLLRYGDGVYNIVRARKDTNGNIALDMLLVDDTTWAVSVAPVDTVVVFSASQHPHIQRISDTRVAVWWHETASNDGYFQTFDIPGESAPVFISPSANVTAGGDATTAQLTPPGSKTTGEFTTGRMWDDENGADAINIASNFYTELEWVLQLSTVALHDEVYQFRVYANDIALDTYTETPEWTVSESVTAVVDPAILILTGETPGFVHVTATAVDPATLTFAGQTPGIIHPTTQIVDPATLTISGQTPGIIHASTATVDPAVLLLTGIDLGLVRAFIDTVGVTDTDDIVLDKVVEGFADAVGITDSIEIILSSPPVVVDPAILTLTGVNVLPGSITAATVDPAVLSLTGITPTAFVEVVVSVDPATLSLTGQTPIAEGSGSATQAVDVATLTFAAQTPIARGSGTATRIVDIATLTFAPQDPIARGSGTATRVVDIATLAFAPQTPIARGSGTTVRTVDIATLTFTGQTPVPIAKVGVTPAILSLSGETPIARGTGSTVRAVDFATLTFTGITPNPTGGVVIATVDVALLSLSAQTPVARGTGTATRFVDTALFTLVGQTPIARGTGTARGTVDPVALTLAPQDVVAKGTGTARGIVDIAALSLTAIQVDGIGSGTVVRVVDIATLTLTGIQPALDMGNVMIPIDPAILSLVPQQPLALGTGNANITVDPALLLLLGVEIGAGIIGFIDYVQLVMLAGNQVIPKDGGVVPISGNDPPPTQRQKLILSTNKPRRPMN